MKTVLYDQNHIINTQCEGISRNLHAPYILARCKRAWVIWIYNDILSYLLIYVTLWCMYTDVYRPVDVSFKERPHDFVFFRKMLSNINVNKKAWSDPALKSAYDWERDRLPPVAAPVYFLLNTPHLVSIAVTAFCSPQEPDVYARIFLFTHLNLHF